MRPFEPQLMQGKRTEPANRGDGFAVAVDLRLRLFIAAPHSFVGARTALALAPCRPLVFSRPAPVFSGVTRHRPVCGPRRTPWKINAPYACDDRPVAAILGWNVVQAKSCRAKVFIMSLDARLVDQSERQPVD
jgi:hypothetical protein